MDYVLEPSDRFKYGRSAKFVRESGELFLVAVKISTGKGRHAGAVSLEYSIRTNERAMLDILAASD